MCRLLGKASIEPENPSLELLQAPHSLRQQAERARAPSGYGPHDDGSGVAWLQSDGIHLEKRGAVDAWGDSFQQVIESMRTTALIAHNRKASPGLEVSAQLSHPYSLQYKGEEIAFCHNGGIQTFMTEARDRKITDSLIFFERLISRVGELTVADMKNFLSESSETWEFSSINGLLLTKTGIFAWRCYQDVKDSSWDRERYCSLYLRQSPERVCIASEPTDKISDWVSVPNRTLLHARLGGDAIQLERALF
jgi:predicted glutamine amidotransferase